MSHIKSVVPLESYRLEVCLDNDSSMILSLESKLHTLRFGMLSEKEVFRKVTTDGNCISWEGKAELSLSEVFQLMQK